MGAVATRWIEGALALIMIFWIVKNPEAVQRVTQSGAKAYVGSVRTLWGGGTPNG
jgi:hypothetical protein